MYINLFEKQDGSANRYQFNAVHIYNENGIIFTTSRDWEQVNIEDGHTNTTGYYAQNIAAYVGTIRNARKIDFTKKDAFTITVTPEYYSAPGKDLYIYCGFIAAEYCGEYIAMQTAEQTCYQDIYKLTFKNIIHETSECKHIICDLKTFTIPQGCQFSTVDGTKEHPNFSWFDFTDEEHPLFSKSKYSGKQGVIAHWREQNAKENYTGFFAKPYYTRIEYSEDRKQAMQISDNLKAHGINLSYYQVEDLQKLYTLTPVEQ